MKITMPVWPVVMTLVDAVVVGLIVGETGWLVVGWLFATIGWLVAIRLRELG